MQIKTLEDSSTMRKIPHTSIVKAKRFFYPNPALRATRRASTETNSIVSVVPSLFEDVFRVPLAVSKEERSELKTIRCDVEPEL
jgi:hypothetical protein